MDSIVPAVFATGADFANWPSDLGFVCHFSVAGLSLWKMDTLVPDHKVSFPETLPAP